MPKPSVRPRVRINDSGDTYLSPLSTLEEKFAIARNQCSQFLRGLGVPVGRFGGRVWYDPAQLELALSDRLRLGGPGLKMSGLFQGGKTSGDEKENE